MVCARIHVCVCVCMYWERVAGDDMKDLEDTNHKRPCKSLNIALKAQDTKDGLITNSNSFLEPPKLFFNSVLSFLPPKYFKTC